MFFDFIFRGDSISVFLRKDDIVNVAQNPDFYPTPYVGANRDVMSFMYGPDVSQRSAEVQSRRPSGQKTKEGSEKDRYSVGCPEEFR